MKTNTSNANKENIGDMFFRLSEKLSKIDNKAEFKLEDETFINAEMHVIKVIKENEDIHVTGIADILGVTKGAVSQIANKLLSKGVIIKEKDTSNMSRIILKLTEKGEKVYDIHAQFHHELDDLINSTLSEASDENREFLQNFLDKLEKRILDVFIK